MNPADLKAARMLAQLTQQQAADLCEVNIRTYRKWEDSKLPKNLYRQKRFLAQAKRRAKKIYSEQPFELPALLRKQAS